MVLSCEIIQRNKFLLETGSHPKDSIIIVLDGNFHCETHNVSYTVGKNEIFLFKGGDSFHREIISPITAIYIVLDTENFVSNQKITPANHTRINEDIGFLVSAITEGDATAENHFVNDILYCCRNSEKESDTMIREVTRYIQENYHQSLSLDQLAQCFGISKQWLILRFKKEMNTTPITYLNHYRMKKAKELLLNQKMSIGEVAFACGFETPYYFSNTFKKMFGISPALWRKNMVL